MRGHITVQEKKKDSDQLQKLESMVGITRAQLTQRISHLTVKRIKTRMSVLIKSSAREIEERKVASEGKKRIVV